MDLPRHSALFAAEGPGVVIGGESPNILVLEVRRLESGGRKDALRRFPFPPFTPINRWPKGGGPSGQRGFAALIPPFLRVLSALSANVFGGGTRRAGARVFGGLFHRMLGAGTVCPFRFDGLPFFQTAQKGRKGRRSACGALSAAEEQPQAKPVGKRKVSLCKNKCG